VRIDGEPKPGSALYEALYPKREKKGERREREIRVFRKQVEVFEWPPAIRTPGEP